MNACITENCRKHFRTQNGLPIVVAYLKSCLSRGVVTQQRGLAILANLCTHEDPDFESELCSLATPLVLRILEVQKKNFGGAPSPEIATTARLTALYFSNVASEGALPTLLHNDVLVEILDLCLEFLKDETVVVVLLAALGNMLISDTMKSTAHHIGLLDVVARLLRLHLSVEQVVLKASLVISNLSFGAGEDIRIDLIALGLFGLLMEGTKEHSHNSHLATTFCMCLSNLIFHVEAAKVVCALGVIQLLCQLHRAHVSQSLYAKYFAVACTNLLQAPTMAAGLAATDLPSCLLDNVMHYDQSPAVLGPTLDALVYLLRGGGNSCACLRALRFASLLPSLVQRNVSHVKILRRLCTVAAWYCGGPRSRSPLSIAEAALCAQDVAQCRLVETLTHTLGNHPHLGIIHHPDLTSVAVALLDCLADLPAFEDGASFAEQGVLHWLLRCLDDVRNILSSPTAPSLAAVQRVLEFLRLVQRGHHICASWISQPEVQSSLASFLQSQYATHPEVLSSGVLLLCNELLTSPPNP